MAGVDSTHFSKCQRQDDSIFAAYLIKSEPNVLNVQTTYMYRIIEFKKNTKQQ